MVARRCPRSLRTASKSLVFSVPRPRPLVAMVAAASPAAARRPVVRGDQVTASTTMALTLLARGYRRDRDRSLRSVAAGAGCAVPVLSSAMQTLGSANGCNRSAVTGALICSSTPCIRPR